MVFYMKYIKGRNLSDVVRLGEGKKALVGR